MRSAIVMVLLASVVQIDASVDAEKPAPAHRSEDAKDMLISRLVDKLFEQGPKADADNTTLGSMTGMNGRLTRPVTMPSRMGLKPPQGSSNLPPWGQFRKKVVMNQQAQASKAPFLSQKSQGMDTKPARSSVAANAVSRYSRGDWLNAMLVLPFSGVLGRITPQLLFQTLVACAVLAAQQYGYTVSVVPQVHSMLAGFLGLLLVFRTWAAYSRFWEGRELWNEAKSYCREIATILTAHVKPSTPETADKLARSLAEYPSALARMCLSEPGTAPGPIQICAELHSAIHEASIKGDMIPGEGMAKDMYSFQLQKISTLVGKLIDVASKCSKLVNTPVPYSMSRHASRFATIFCATLPLVLAPVIGYMTIPAVIVASWAIMGIEELGKLLEQPFMSSDGQYVSWDVGIPIDRLAAEMKAETLMSAKLPLGERWQEQATQAIAATSATADLDKVDTTGYTQDQIEFLARKKKERAEKKNFVRPPAVDVYPLSGAAEKKAAKKEDEIDVTGQTFNLIKNIVGAGVLSLPAGVAAIGGDPKLLVPAMTAVTVMGIVSAYTFYSIGRQCGVENAKTYNEAFTKAVGPATKPFATFIAFVYPIIGCLAYAITIGDLFASLSKGGILGSAAQASAIACDRRTWIVGITSTALYGLCSLKDLGALAVTSLLGTGAVLFTMFFMILRYFDGTYLPGGIFHSALIETGGKLPCFDCLGGGLMSGFATFAQQPATMVLIAMLATAYMAHPNAPAYFEAVSRDKGKFKTVVIFGFGASILMSLIFLVAGYLTWGSASAGVILNNYANTDPLAAAARAALGVSLVFTYPLIFVSFKSIARQVMGMFGMTPKEGPVLDQALTIIPLAVITFLAATIPNAGLVNAFKGAVCGSCFIYIFPALMYLISQNIKVKNPMEKGILMGSAAFGVFMGVSGIAATLKGR